STATRRFAWAAIAAAGSFALLLGAKQFLRTAGSLDPKRAYVAPFENRTGDATLDQIGGMASDWVSQALEQSGVIAVATAARAEDARPAQPRELGAGTLVSGAYYRLGNRLRFHVQINDVASGDVLDAFDAVGDTVADPSVTL